MSIEPTPENIVADLRAYASAVDSTGPWRMADTMRAAADRIEGLEAALREATAPRCCCAVVKMDGLAEPTLRSRALFCAIHGIGSEWEAHKRSGGDSDD